MKFKNLPAIVTLLAALITCIISIVCNVDATSAMWRLLIAVIIFYILSMIAKKVLNSFFKEDEKKEAEEKEETEEAETEDKDDEEDTEEDSDSLNPDDSSKTKQE